MFTKDGSGRPDVDGNTPLMLATRMGHAEALSASEELRLSTF